MNSRIRLFSLGTTILALGCGDAEVPEIDEIAQTNQALSTVVDVEPWISVLAKGLDSATYKDIASSNTKYFLLTTTGIKSVDHGNESQIASAPLVKAIALDAIDYTDSTWNVIGVRNGGQAQLVLKALNSSPITVSLTPDITTVKDIEAIVESSTRLRLFVRTSATVVREFLYNNGVLSSVRSITWNANDTCFAATNSGTFVANNTDSYPSLWKRTLSPPWHVNEALKIDIDNTAAIDEVASGKTTNVHIHGFNGTSARRAFSSFHMDYSGYNGQLTPGLSALVSTGTGRYDLVRFNYSNIKFDKRPARSFADWNDNLLVRKNNNCYNYGTNRETGNYAQPGYGSTGTNLTSYMPNLVKQAAVSDGLEWVAAPGDGTFPNVPEGKTLVAAIAGLAPNYAEDYHWFRRDRDGNWTHKPASLAATNHCYPYREVDPLVTDPRVSSCWNSDKYDTFVGFFLADNNYYQTMGVENVNGNREVHAPTAYSDAGAIEVTFSIYSGRPDPVLRITEPSTIRRITELYAEASGSSIVASTASSNEAGHIYSGVYLENIGTIAGMPDVAHLGRDRISTQYGMAPRLERGELLASTSKLETYLLNLALESGVIDMRTRDRISTLDAK